MTATDFDPTKFKAAQRANWDALSSGWLACRADFERGAALVTARLLDLAGIGPGHRVLDVGTGTGEPALTAASVVGATGRVVGIDLAPAMVRTATELADGTDNVEFAVGDVESLTYPANSFDAVVSRWGLMFAVDHVAALRALAEVLVPGGLLAASTWGVPPGDVPITSLGFQVLSARVDLPPGPPGAPGPFSMGDPDVLRAELTEAGFRDIEIADYDVPFVFDSVEGVVEYNRRVTPPGLLAAVRDRFGSEDDPETWAALADAAQRYRTQTGQISLPSKALLVRAVAG